MCLSVKKTRGIAIPRCSLLHLSAPKRHITSRHPCCNTAKNPVSPPLRLEANKKPSHVSSSHVREDAICRVRPVLLGSKKRCELG
jgi:hypothetical protein